MSSEPSVHVIPSPPRRICPVCHQSVYSLGGVHPQCAIEQADRPRLIKLRAAKAAEQKVKKPVRHSWQKRCPECGTESHLRLRICKCGHNFDMRPQRPTT